MYDFLNILKIVGMHIHIYIFLEYFLYFKIKNLYISNI